MTRKPNNAEQKAMIEAFDYARRSSKTAVLLGRMLLAASLVAAVIMVVEACKGNFEGIAACTPNNQ